MDRRRTTPLTIAITLAAQRLDLLRDGVPWKGYSVSTSKHGAGEVRGSLQTPRGAHVIRAKIGAVL